MVDVKIDPSWKIKLSDEFDKNYFKNLTDFVRSEYQSKTVYPPAAQIFNAFNHCTFANCKVVILGQDPYHGAKQANGLSFSVNDGITLPPSLRNIFKELNQDLQVPVPNSGNLERWAKQGVLLLNATLTVQDSTPGSHQKKGWEEFTDAVIRTISEKKEHVVFLLWGNYAQKKGAIINSKKHLVLNARHPSPMAANQGGWFGCKHFSKTNLYLEEKGLPKIEW